MNTRVLALMFMGLSCLPFQSYSEQYSTTPKVDKGGSADAKQSEQSKQIDQMITRAWFASNDLETLLGLVSLAPKAKQYGISGIIRQQALDGAKQAAATVEAELNKLMPLRNKADNEQVRAIDAMVMVAHSRIVGLNATLIAFAEGDGLEDVTSCTGFWCCLGFKKACEGANGEWEDQGGSTETCTTEEVDPQE